MAAEFNVNILPFNQSGTFSCSQYDVGRTATITLLDEEGEYTIPTGATVTINATKPSGFGFSEECEWDGSTVTIETTATMTEEAGKFPAELRIEFGDTVLVSANFLFRVEESAHLENVVDGDAETAQALTIRMTALESDVADLKSAISRGGMSAEVKAALLNCFENVAWANSNGQTYYDALETALYPPVEIVSITAVYTQSGTVYDTDSLDSLKTDLVVTAHYDDDTSETVFNYTLTGTLTTGTSTITVSYGGKTDTFNVTVSEWTTSPAIAKTDTYWETNMQEASATGFCITEKYWYDLDMDALKATAKYDSTNDCFTVDGASLFGAFLCPNSQSISVGGRNKLVYFGGDNVAITYATMNFGSKESAFLSRKSSTQWTNIAQNKIGLSFTLITDDVENAYAYFKTTQSGVMPVGVSAGDIIFAGANTPYYGKTNIND